MWFTIIPHGNDHDHAAQRLALPRHVIRSFNDKPYPRFVEEQVAGDVLFPIAQKRRWPGSAARQDDTLMSTIREDTVDHRMGQNSTRQHGQHGDAAASLTVHCAVSQSRSIPSLNASTTDCKRFSREWTEPIDRLTQTHRRTVGVTTFWRGSTSLPPDRRVRWRRL